MLWIKKKKKDSTEGRASYNLLFLKDLYQLSLKLLPFLEVFIKQMVLNVKKHNLKPIKESLLHYTLLEITFALDHQTLSALCII